jgi:hypothetical protein
MSHSVVVPSDGTIIEPNMPKMGIIHTQNNAVNELASSDCPRRSNTASHESLQYTKNAKIIAR